MVSGRLVRLLMPPGDAETRAWVARRGRHPNERAAPDQLRMATINLLAVL
jgi:hypothetical protein